MAIIMLWNAPTGERLPIGKGKEVIRAHLRGVSKNVFASNTMVSIGQDPNVKLWDLASGQEEAIFRGHRFIPTGLAISSDCRGLATTGQDTNGRLWSMPSGEELETETPP